MKYFPSLIASIFLVLSGCSSTTADDILETRVLSLNESILVGDLKANPADPYLNVAPDGTIFLSWTEDSKDAEGRDAFIASASRKGLGKSRRMNDRPGQVHQYGGDNRTKFTVTPDGGIAAVWSATLPEYKTGEMRVTYADEDGSFHPAVTLNDDGMPVNHAFGTIATSPNGKLYASWIDGRNRNFVGMADPLSPAEARKNIKMKDLTIPESTMQMGPRQRKEYEHDNSQLMMAVSEDSGRTWGKNYPITGMKVCSCCVPNIAFLDRGETVVVSYRFVAEDFLRDQVVVRSIDGGKTFSEPTYMSQDGWIAEFCPHAATSMANDNQGKIHLAWFTAGRTDEETGIYYTYSEDGGQSFAPRHLLSSTPPHTILHAEVRADENDTIWVAWENFVDNRPQIFLAHLDQDTGKWSKSHQVSDGTNNSILPMLAAGGDEVYVAWTERKGETSKVRLRSATLARY